MWRLQYRNFGRFETLLGSFATRIDDQDHVGVRWFELRRSPPASSPWVLHQEGTHAPDGDNRWKSSIAMDACGNIALGYSVAGSSTEPGCRYTGRLQGDAPGIMTASEVVRRPEQAGTGTPGGATTAP
jgi:hypothetical protein